MTDKKKADAAFSMAVTYKKLFSTPDGKVVLKDLMKSCHFLEMSTGVDANDTYFRLGERSVVMRILEILDMDLDKLREVSNELYTFEEDE